MSLEQKVIAEFVENAIYRLEESTRMITIAFDQLSEEEVWFRPNAQSNSMGNLIVHLCGNITQYVISSLGEQPDMRERDAEFAITSGMNKETLLRNLNRTVAEAIAVIKNTSVDQWVEKRDVQGFNFSGIGVVLHAVEHYSYHTGQIAFFTKELRNSPLGFYAGTDLNIKNNEN